MKFYGNPLTRKSRQTLKSTAVTKTAVSQKLRQSFQEELGHLTFRDVEVELKELGGSDGIFYHKLVLTRTPGMGSLELLNDMEALDK